MAVGEDTELAGRVLAGRWRVERRLGEGGMGEVLLATELATDRPVAIKRLPVAFTAEPEFLTRFQREAKLLARLDHPALVQLLSFEVAEGVPLLVMKYAEGKTLEAVLRERTRLSVRQALPLLDQLCSALDYLHSRGVVHRDLKPGNLIVDAEDRLTVLDFGISLQRGSARLTSPGHFVGTPLYSAPEQITSDDCDPPADLYALALITWQVLVGEHPFGNTHAPGDVLLLQVSAAPTLASRANPAVPQPVARVIARSLEKDPKLRHPTARAFYEDLVRAFGLDGTEGARADAHAGPVPAPAPELAAALAPTAPARPQGRAPLAETGRDLQPARALPRWWWALAAAGLVALALAVWRGLG